MGGATVTYDLVISNGSIVTPDGVVTGDLAVNGDTIAGGRQVGRLFDHGLGVFVAQKNIRNFRH